MEAFKTREEEGGGLSWRQANKTTEATAVPKAVVEEEERKGAEAIASYYSPLGS